MITEDDSYHTFEYDYFYIIHPTLPFWTYKPYIPGGKKVAEGFSYTSGNNTRWLTDAELKGFVDTYLAEKAALITQA